jgi:hypothetical protein
MLQHDGFDVVENADGTRTMLDVPVFYECERDGDEYSAEWIGAAFDRLREWERDGHLPPLTIGHRRKDNPEPEGAGWFRATRVGRFRGRRAIFADLTLNDRAWREVSAKRLPYRSAEVVRPGRGEPEVESVALLDNAPYLQMPMTFAKSGGGVTGATEAEVTPVAADASLAPVVAFASFGDRCLIFSEAPMRKRKFAKDAPDESKPDGEAPPAPPKAEDAPAPRAAAGMSEAVQKISDLAATAVPLQDVPAVIRLLEEKLAALKGAMRPPEDDHDEQDDEDDAEDGGEDKGVRPSDDTSEPDGKSKPPANGKEPMNMSADNSKVAGPVDAEALAKFAAENAALKGRMDAFEAEQKRERAIFAAVKDLADYNIGGEPEAVIRGVVTEAGDAWEKTLAIFSAHTKKIAPKRGRSGASDASLPEADSELYPAEVAALGCKTPEDGAVALRCFAAWKANSGGVPFDAYHKFNAKHFGALAGK